jgi:hypothetical protein
MQDQPNLDPWTYYTRKVPNEFLEFALNSGAPDPRTSLQSHNKTVEVQVADFVDYILANEATCQKKWFHPRDILSAESNIEMALPLTVGMHQGNTFEYNWGLYENTNQEVKELIGENNLVKMGYDPDTVLARLIVYMPGHGIPLHRDTMDGWKGKFPQHRDKNVQRQLLMVTDWHWGHILQVDNTVTTHWASGDVFEIPTNHWHLSSNQGVVPKITVSLTGVIV